MDISCPVTAVFRSMIVFKNWNVLLIVSYFVKKIGGAYFDTDATKEKKRFIFNTVIVAIIFFLFFRL
jgi:hypothetical protein